MPLRSVSIFLTYTLLPCGFLLAGEAEQIWTRGLQPLLDKQCVKCHGPIEQKSDLELDTPEAVLRGGDEGPAVQPGEPEKSRLYQYLAADADPHMPPKSQLTNDERKIFHTWISALAKPKTEAAPVVSLNFTNIPDAVDGFLKNAWQAHGITAAAPAAESVWARRLYLDLAGRIPSLVELDNFLHDVSPDKKTKLVDGLLTNKDFAQHQRALWDVFLMGRGKRENSSERRREQGWYGFLENAFEKNRPWNLVVKEMIRARPDTEESKGSSWFVYERRNEHQLIAEAVAPIIYGTKLDCAQCHDHPLAREIKQSHYWGLVSAFSRSKNVDGSNLVSESAIGGYQNFTNLKKESQSAKVIMLTGLKLAEHWPVNGTKEEDADGNYVDAKAKARVPKNSRREAFAQLATADNPLLARAFVNRVWSILFGRGIVHPVDEMNARNVPSHPELLDWLAKDFEKNHFDMRHVYRGLVMSEAYGLAASQAAPQEFAGTLERALTAEQIARSWQIALGKTELDASLNRDFASALPDVLPADYTATFQQAQFFTNSPTLTKLLEPTASPLNQHLARMGDASERIREAYLHVYGRIPDAEELAACRALIERPDGTPEGRTRDLLWALLTNAEFLMTP